MAVNYNHSGIFLGVFDSVKEVKTSYGTPKDALCVVGGVLYYCNGTQWSQMEFPDYDERITGMEGDISSLFEWSYDKASWSQTPLEPTEAKPKVYIRYRRNGVYSTPVLWSMYSRDGKDVTVTAADVYMSQSVYAATTTPGLSALTTALNAYSGTVAFQSVNYVPSGWSATLPLVSTDAPVLVCATRERISGVWGEYSSPVVIYRAQTVKKNVDVILTNQSVTLVKGVDGTFSSTAVTMAKVFVDGIEVSTPTLTFSIPKIKVNQNGTIKTVACGSVENENGTLTFTPLTSMDASKNITVTFDLSEYGHDNISLMWNIGVVRQGTDGENAVFYDIMTDKYVVKHSGGTFGTDNSFNILVAVHDGNNRTLYTPVEFSSIGSVELYKDGVQINFDVTTAINWTGKVVVVDSMSSVSSSELNSGKTVYIASPKKGITINVVVDDEVVDYQNIRVIEDGEVDYTVVETYVSQYINDDTTLKSVKEIITTIEDNDGIDAIYSRLSSIEQNADSIALQVKDDYSSAGLAIYRDNIRLEAEKVVIANGSGNPAALFQDGYLNADFIKAVALEVSKLNAKDTAGNTTCTINADGDGAYVINYPGSNAKMLRIFPADDNGDSVIQFFDKNGSELWHLGRDATITKSVVTSADTSYYETLNISSSPYSTAPSQSTVIASMQSVNVLHSNDENNLNVYKSLSSLTVVSDGTYYARYATAVPTSTDSTTTTTSYRRKYWKVVSGKLSSTGWYYYNKDGSGVSNVVIPDFSADTSVSPST